MSFFSAIRYTLIVKLVIWVTVFYFGTACAKVFSTVPDDPDGGSLSGPDENSSASCTGANCPQPDGTESGSYSEVEEDSGVSCTGANCSQPDGEVLYTDSDCDEPDTGSGSCKMGFEEYPSGTADILSLDGCNTCSCQEGGWDCTLNPCIRRTGKIELYQVKKEQWRSEVVDAYDLKEFVIGDPVLTADDIVSYDWDNHLLRTTEQVLERWERAGFIDSNRFAFEPVLFLLLANNIAVSALVLWPMQLSSLPPYPYFYPRVDEGTVLIQIYLPDALEDVLNHGKLYKALWEAKLLLNPATGRSTCAFYGIRYPEGIEHVTHPTNYNNCECRGGYFACNLMALGDEKKESEYGLIVNGTCSEYVSIDNPTFRNGFIYLDCGTADGGLSYYFYEGSGELISECGGACLAPDEKQLEVCNTLCPPPGF